MDKFTRGTYLKVQFSPTTRLKSLSKLAASRPIWETILRTKTALGQVLLGRHSICQIKSTLTIIESGRETNSDIIAEFLYPHDIVRKPEFRFLDLPKYYKTHSEQSSPPPDKLRQDGVYLVWDTERIRKELTTEQQSVYQDELISYAPQLYAFVPYQGSIWGRTKPDRAGGAESQLPISRADDRRKSAAIGRHLRNQCVKIRDV